MRWKFVENRTIEFKGNAGLTLPSNIGELGDSVTKTDLGNRSLGGELYFVCPSIHALYGLLTFPPCFTGELPKELGNLVNLTELNLSRNQFEGKLYVPSYMRLCVHF